MFFQKLAGAGNMPMIRGAHARNAMLDWFFYDVEGLSAEERAVLVAGPNTEGSIILVWPRDTHGPVSLARYDGHEALLAAPGPVLTRFTIAGVGSSDIGAAAFARSAANALGEPVGAIVAGYGVADLLSEAMGGWFVMGGANRVMRMYRDAVDHGEPDSPPEPVDADPTVKVEHRRDSATLAALMLDEGRRIRWLGGHSKGCASIRHGLDALIQSGRNDAVRRQDGMRITTIGSVTRMPEPFANTGQYLGELDWFGGMNSSLDLDYVTIPGAWHHLNTAVPGHLDLNDVLAQEPRQDAA